MSDPDHGDELDRWLAALEHRHLADLRLPEVTRALRALSSAYVHRRHAVARGATLDGAGKRAAFALYYAPLHFMTVRAIVNELRAAESPPSRIVDIGCGTGAGGAAWAVAAGRAPRVFGMDRNPWAVSEARWNYREFGLTGTSKQGDAARVAPLRPGEGAIAAYTMNELPEPVRMRVEDWLLTGARAGARVLVVEPIAKAITPWWETTAEHFRAAGGRADEWRFPVTLPPLLSLLDNAAGLRHTELTARSLYHDGR